ncbi:MAG TPA: hypothetical protein VG838_00110 [Opitutaceae bacterium]|nr:hypothetical protein [Opitutaceae bacterium]
MIKAFKAFFLARQLREKLLLGAFIAAIVAIWLSSFSGRARLFLTAAKNARDTLATQDAWLAKSDAIDARTKAAVTKLDPLKTYNANLLLGVIDRLGKEEFGNKVTVSTEPSKTQGQFATHTVTANITATNTEADWELLKKFYLDLQKLAPYVNLEEFTLSANGAGRAGTGGTMTVRLRATAIERISNG